MKATVFRGTGVLSVEERNLPEPAPNEVVIRVGACGICGTDQHIYHGAPGSAPVVPPRILGHELSGQITAVGQQVSLWKIGDRVTVDPNIYCGSCRFCRGGRPHLCDHLQAIGVTRDGGMAQYAVVPAANCFHLPDELTFEQGALIEPLGCCLHGIEQLTIRPGTSAVVIGGGFIGLLMVQLLRSHGCGTLVVCEPDANKYGVALDLGATKCVSVGAALEQAAAEQPGGGFDIVVECVGRADSMQSAVRVAGKGSQVLLFGVANPGTSIAINPFDVFSKELQIKGSFINPHTHESAIALVQQGKIDVLRMVSHRFTLDELPDVMATYRELQVVKGIVSLISD